MEKTLPKTMLFSSSFFYRFWEVWEGFWERFGRGLDLLSASWATFERHFLVLVFGMVFKSALGGFWARFWFDFRGFGMDLGRVWEGLGRILGGILGDSG